MRSSLRPLIVLALNSVWLAACSNESNTAPNESNTAPSETNTAPNDASVHSSQTDVPMGEGSEPLRANHSTEFTASPEALDAGERGVVTWAASSALYSSESSAPDTSHWFDASLPSGVSVPTASSEPDASGGVTSVWLDTADAGSRDVTDPDELPRVARLVVADAEAWAIYIYDIPSLELVGQIDGVHFAEHAGFLPLDNGQVLFTDDQNYTLNVHDVFGPTPGELRLIAPLALPPVHLAVDPGQRYAAVSGIDGNGGPATMTLTDLQSPNWDTVYVDIPSGEPGVLLGGDPLLLYHRKDEPAAMETYAFDSLWTGEVELLSSAPLGGGPHGEAISHAAGKLFVAADDGIYVTTASGTELSESRVVAYAASGRTGGRAYYGRLSTNANYVYSYLRTDSELGWREWTNDAYILDVNAETATRIEIGNGLVYRLAESSRYASYAQYHPDGDFAHFLDTDPTSETFHTFVGKVPLPAMSKTPTGEDASPWESEAFRLTGILPSGAYAFVTHGGDGKISVIDTSRMSIVGTITTPSPLDFGGYLLGMEQGARTSDTLGR